MSLTLSCRTAFIAGLLVTAFCASLVPGQGPPELMDFTNTKLEDLGVRPVERQKDPKTGFVVGGKNATSLIEKLTELNGRTIAELEKDMRPGAMSEVGSRSGFLGKDEKLLIVLAADNAHVVDRMGVTHQELAKHLHVLAAIGARLEKEERPETPFRYHGRRYVVKLTHSRGFQLSPFLDGTKSGTNATVMNLDTNKKLDYALLVPHMIERYGFYEGEGTPYRVDPAKVLEVLDFLKPKKK